MVTCLQFTYFTEQVSQAKKAEENPLLQIAMLIKDSRRAELSSLTEANILLSVPRNRNEGTQKKMIKCKN